MLHILKVPREVDSIVVSVFVVILDDFDKYWNWDEQAKEKGLLIISQHVMLWPTYNFENSHILGATGIDGDLKVPPNQSIKGKDAGLR